MRKEFFDEMDKVMETNLDVYLLFGGLGYPRVSEFQHKYPNRAINCEASEQAMIGIGVGLALQGKKPFCYSITTFLLYRAFETIRNYIDHEKIPVRLIGSGRDRDYEHDGFSHWSEDVYNLFDTKLPANFSNIFSYWPDTKEEIPDLVQKMVNLDVPQFISLRR